MKFHIVVFALAFATVWAKDLHSRSIEIPVLESGGRIASGKNALPGQFPYQVGINNKKKEGYFYWCGGSLIAKEWILTSAICIVDTLSAWVYLGATERLVAEEFYTVSRTDMILYPGWNKINLRNDIGLIKIPITFPTGTVGIVRIPRDDYDKYVGKLVVIAGWGQTSDDSAAISNDLKFVRLRVTVNYNCYDVYRSRYFADIHLCVSASNFMAPCHGDEGGPLVLEGLDELQIGVLSYSAKNGCERGLPAVFTRVGAYASWIRSHIDL